MTEDVATSALPDAPVRTLRRQAGSVLVRLVRRLVPPPPPQRQQAANRWQLAAADSSAAFRRWCSAVQGERAAAYAAYQAALEREEAAARGLARLTRR